MRSRFFARRHVDGLPSVKRVPSAFDPFVTFPNDAVFAQSGRLAPTYSINFGRSDGRTRDMIGGMRGRAAVPRAVALPLPSGGQRRPMRNSANRAPTAPSLARTQYETRS
jgi:hypothetical protein